MKRKLIIHSSFIRKRLRVILLKMKLLSVLLFTGSMVYAASSYSQMTKIDLQLRNASMTEILNSIEKKSEFIFIYNKKIVDLKEKKSISVKDESIEAVLEQLFRNTGVMYRVDDRQVFLYKDDEIQMLPIEAVAEIEQPKKIGISGKVTDSKGDPIPGASVVVKGTTIGTVTGGDGTFVLEVPEESKILSVSFVGFETVEITIGTKSVFSVILKELTVGLEEVVAVGYGVQKKESVVGSIVQATSEQLRQTGNVTDLKQALTGQLPGITTIVSSGEPGGTGTGESATSIFIRGRSTWNGGQPLILVDGAERNMDNLDVSEVESISVLKDASATAVFGVKGANGVILITTKRGSVSKPKLSFSYNATALSVSKLPEKLDSYDVLRLKNEMIEREGVLNSASWGDYTPVEILNRYKKPQSDEYAVIYPNVDWVDAVFRDVSFSHRAALNIQGGSSFVKYFGSMTYLNEGDMFKRYENHKGYDPNFDFNRFNFRSNLDFNITRTTNFKISLAGYYSQKNTNNTYMETMWGTNRLAYAAAYSMPPTACLPQYEDGRFGASFDLPLEYVQNPVAIISNIGILTRKTTQLNADFSLGQKLDFITKGLSAKASLFYDNSIQTKTGINDATFDVSLDKGNTPMKVIDPDLYKGPDQDPSEYTFNLPSSGTYLFDWIYQPWAIISEEVTSTNYTGYLPVSRRMMYQFQLDYTRQFGSHNVGAMGLVKREEYAVGNMFKNYREDWVSRITYDYDARYLLEFNGAYNGSEKFGPGYRFDFFPSMAVGWYVTNEKFFKVEWINRLKLRYSIGMVGDDQGGGRWLYENQYIYNQNGGAARLNSNVNEYSPYRFYAESVIGNPDIHWEKATKSNYGIEMGILDNLISVNFDYFTEDRTDILVASDARASIPPYFGATVAPSANVGAVKSNGYEIELKLSKRSHSGFYYWTNLAFTRSMNKILKRDEPELLESYLKQSGYPIGQSRTLVSADFYNNWDEIFASVPIETNDLQKLPGYYNLVDFNGDGVITSAADRIALGYSEVPENTCNLSFGTEYKGFSVMVQFYGVNNVSRYFALPNYAYYQNNLYAHALDYWSKDNPDASSFLPRWKTQGQNVGDYFLYDGSYIRLKTAEIAYSLQDKLVKKIGLGSLRFFVNGNNLLFWSKLPEDREAAWSGGSSSEGAYPTPRRINFGFDLTF